MKKSGLIIILVLLSGFGAWLFWLSKNVNDQFKDPVVAAINAQLNAEVAVQNLDMSLWSSFPQVSLRLDTILIHDPLYREDTLLYADELLVKFSLLDLWKKRYNAKGIAFTNALIKLRNYKGELTLKQIIKENENGEGGPFNSELENIHFTNTRYQYWDDSKVFSVSGNIVEGKTRVYLNQTLTELETQLTHTGFQLISGLDTLLVAKPLTLNQPFTIYPDSLVFESGDLEYESLETSQKGRINLSNSGWAFTVSTQSTDITPLLSIYPRLTRTFSDAYNFSGELTTQCTFGQNTEGAFFVESENTVKAGKVTHRKNQITASNIFWNGTFIYNSSQTKFTAKRLNATLPSGALIASGTYDIAPKPKVNGTITGEVNLNKMALLFDLPTPDLFDGKVAIDAKLSGDVPQNLKNLVARNDLKISGKLSLNNIAFPIGVGNHQIQDVTGDVALLNQRILLNQLHFSNNQSTGTIDAALSDFLPLILYGEGNANLNGKVKFDSFHANDWIFPDTKSTENASNERNINFNLAFQSDVLSIGKIEAKQVSATALGTLNQFDLKDLKFKAWDGSVNANLFYSSPQALGRLAMNATLTTVSLEKMFAQFNNFGQSVVTSKEISGNATIEMEMSTEIGKDFMPIEQSITGKADITIDKGRLQNLGVFKDLVTALKENRIARTFIDIDYLNQRLSDVQFETLKNQIVIANSTVSFPEMTIASNLVSMNINGSHTFDNHIDYDLDFRLGELNFRPKEDENGYLQDDGTGYHLYLTMTGTVDNPEVSLNKKAASDARKEKFRKEVKTAGSIIKDEVKSIFRPTGLDEKPEDKGVKFTIEPEKTSETEIGKKAPDSNNKNQPSESQNKKEKKKKSSKIEEDLILDDDF